MERSKLIGLLMYLNELLKKFDYYLKFDFSKSIKKVQQLLFLIDFEFDDYILYEQLDYYFLNQELFDYIHISDLERNINVEKITKQGITELLESWYRNFELLDPYLKYIFIDENKHIQDLLCMFKYEGQYVSTRYILKYINLCYFKDDKDSK